VAPQPQTRFDLRWVTPEIIRGKRRQARNFFAAIFLIVCRGRMPPKNGRKYRRGPPADGHSPARGLPLHWSETNQVKWKTAIPWTARGPRLWWTATNLADHGRLKMEKNFFAIQVDRNSGRRIRRDTLKLFTGGKFRSSRTNFNSYRFSDTDAFATGAFYVTFGSPGTACFGTKKYRPSPSWERRDFGVATIFRGAGFVRPFSSKIF